MKNFFKVISLNIAIMVVLVIALVFGLTAWLKSYTHHNESIKVPDVIGMVDDEAMYYIEKAGLKSLVIDSLYADATPGAVIEQLPEGGLPVKHGRIVYLTINAKSVKMIRMVDVKDFSSRQARSLLREAGFIIDRVEYKAHEFDDLVLGAQIGGRDAIAGEEYPIRSHVTLIVGSTSVEVSAENDDTEDAWFE